MSAEDHLGPQFQHVSPYKLKIGAEIRPGGRPANFDNDRSGSHTYMSTGFDRPEYYQGMFHEMGMPCTGVYDVEPTAPVEPDPHSGDAEDYRSQGNLKVIGISQHPIGHYWPPGA